MLYNLKKIGWYFDKDELYLYKGNPLLKQKINSDNNKKIFDFIKAMNKPISKEDLKKSLNNLSSKEFNSIFNFFLDQKWIYPVKKPVDISHFRLSNFIDCFPQYSYPEYINKVKKTNILIMGLGTGGSYLLEVLSKLGFQNFIIIDGDKVEEKNILAQNYKEKDVGKYKIDIIKNKYNNSNIKIKAINKIIKSYNELKKLVDFNNIDYFINCADDFELQMNMISKIFNEYPKMKMLYGGYSFLMHSDDFITKNNYKRFMDIAIEDSKNLSLNNYVIENTGCILNGFISATTTGIYLLNDIKGGKNKDQFLGDFYHNKFQFFNQGELR